jgi:hypothetical protein
MRRSARCRENHWAKFFLILCGTCIRPMLGNELREAACNLDSSESDNPRQTAPETDNRKASNWTLRQHHRGKEEGEKSLLAVLSCAHMVQALHHE